MELNSMSPRMRPECSECVVGGPQTQPWGAPKDPFSHILVELVEIDFVSGFVGSLFPCFRDELLLLM